MSWPPNIATWQRPLRLFQQQAGHPRDGVPDGICLDAEGAIWVAGPWSNRATRILDGGHVAQVVTVAEGRCV